MLRNLLLLLLASLVISACKQQSPESPLSNLKIKWEVVSNLEKDTPECHAILSFKNEGTKAISGEDWELFFNHSPRNVRKTLGPGKFVQIDGDFYKFSPAKGFELPPGDSLKVHYYVEAWMVKQVDGPRGAYFVNGQAKVIETQVDTKNFWLGIESSTRHRGDSAKFPSHKVLYERNASFNYPKNVSPTDGPGFEELGATLHIEYSEGLENEIQYFEEVLKDFSNTKITFHKAPYSDPGCKVHFLLSDAAHLQEEGFQLSICDKKVNLEGKTPQGVFYGLQQLIRYMQSSSLSACPDTVYTDHPRFSYRGLHLDVARNFQKPETVKKLIDVMAFYRLNTLHFHLTEDEGWRLEIPGLPELTEVGSKRLHAGKDDNALHPSYGSGPHADFPGSGYYSRNEYIDLLKYAKSRHVTVIPEINFPGHARAAIKAMNARYERLMQEGKEEEAQKYWLIDPQDSSQYLSAQHYTDNVSCVCKESVFDFYDKVMNEVIQMYREADAKLEVIHTGGDEVPRGAWEGSPICQDFLKEHPEISSFRELEKYFHRRLAKSFAQKGYQLAGWEEIAMNPDGSVNPEFVEDSFLTYVWNNLWGAADLGNRLANAGYPVVLCNVTNLYFDLAYNASPWEPGLYWGGFVDTRDAFSMMPYNVFAGTREDNMERKLGPEDFRNLEKLTPQGEKNILGIQAELWSETIEGGDMLEYYLLPKLIGMAEIAWNRNLEADEKSASPWENRLASWEELAMRIGTQDLPILERIFGGYNYRLPAPGGVIRNDSLYVNVEFPGLTILYTLGKGDPSFENAKVYEGPVKVEEGATVWVTDGKRQRTSSFLWIENDQKK